MVVPSPEESSELVFIRAVLAVLALCTEEPLWVAVALARLDVVVLGVLVVAVRHIVLGREDSRL